MSAELLGKLTGNWESGQKEEGPVGSSKQALVNQ